MVSTVVVEAERSPIKPLKGLLKTKCAYVGFENYVHTVLKVHELNRAQAIFLEHPIYSTMVLLQYAESVVSSTHTEQEDVRHS